MGIVGVLVVVVGVVRFKGPVTVRTWETGRAYHVVIIQSLLLLAFLDTLGVNFERKLHRLRQLQQSANGISHVGVSFPILTWRSGPDAKNIFVSSNTHDHTNDFVISNPGIGGKRAANNGKQELLPVQASLASCLVADSFAVQQSKLGELRIHFLFLKTKLSHG